MKAQQAQVQSSTPLTDALEAAQQAAEATEKAYKECECADRFCVHLLACRETDTALDSAKAALAASDEPRDWELTEEGFAYDTIEASSLKEALDEAKSNVDRANYRGCGDEHDGETTFWIDVRVWCEATGEEDGATVQVDPEEPDCSSDTGYHDWQSPHALVGGCEENPGVHGHGGGVIISEVCMHCGCGRTTDTWAQNRETGEQGLESVEYEPGEYDLDEFEETEG